MYKKTNKKIDIYLKHSKTGYYEYEVSTMWYTTAKEAKKSFLQKYNFLHPSQVKASISLKKS